MTLIVTDCNNNQWWCDVANPMTPIMYPIIIKNDGFDRIEDTEYFCKFTQCGSVLLNSFFQGKKKVLYETKEEITHSGSFSEIKKALFDEYKGDTLIEKELFSIMTPYGRKSLIGDMYRESFENSLYTFDCSGDLKKWAYAQFGLGNFYFRK